MVHARDSDDDHGEKPGGGTGKAVATISAWISVAYGLAQIVSEVLSWFT